MGNGRRTQQKQQQTCLPEDRLNGLQEKKQEVCAFTLICQLPGEEPQHRQRFWLPPLSCFYEEFDGGRQVSHHMGALPSAMAVIELRLHCLGVNSSEVKSPGLFIISGAQNTVDASR